MSRYRVCLNNDYADHKVGGPVYVSTVRKVTPTLRGWFPRRVVGRCSRLPFRDRLSLELILHGECGTTRGESETAVGVGVIVDIDKANSDRTLYRVRLAEKGSKMEADLLKRLQWGDHLIQK